MHLFLYVYTVMPAASSMTPTVTTGKILLVLCYIKLMRAFVLTAPPISNSTTEQPSSNIVNQSSNMMHQMMTLITFPADITCEISKVCGQPISTVHESYNM